MPIVSEFVAVVGEESRLWNQNLPRPSPGQLSAVDADSSLVWIIWGLVSGIASN